MIKLELVTSKRKDDDGKLVDVVEMLPVLDRRSGEPIVTESRQPAEYRALPRKNRDRLQDYLKTGTWKPLYQTYDRGLLVGVGCWKCGRELVGWYPALRRFPSMKKDDTAELVKVNGQPAVRIVAHNHYREGLFRYRRPDGIFSEFSYLHCADCVVMDADGEALLDCLLAGHDHTRELCHKNLLDDDAWALWMWRWSAIDLIGRKGPSLGPADLMEQAAKEKRTA